MKPGVAVALRKDHLVVGVERADAAHHSNDRSKNDEPLNRAGGQ